MARRREIRPGEATLWLGVLLDAAFDPTSKRMSGALRLTARDGQSQLLGLASDFTSYPEEYSDQRRAELLLVWADRWMLPEDWTRLAARVRKRRERIIKQ